MVQARIDSMQIQTKSILLQLGAQHDGTRSHQSAFTFSATF